MLQHCPGRVGRRWRFRFLPADSRRRRRRKHVNLCCTASNFMRRLWNTTVHAPTADECPQHAVLLIHSCFQCHSEMFVRLLMHVLHSRLQQGVRKGLALIWAQIQTRRSCSAKMTSESGRASDSEEIERRTAPGLRDHDPGPAPTTPGGTPLPRGPPPPRAIHEEQQAISHKLSGALGQAMLEQGVYLRQILTLLPANWQHLDSITVQIGPQTPAQAFHPNNVNFEEDYVDPEPGADEAEAAEGEGSSGSARVTSAVASAPWRTTASSKPQPKANTKHEPCLSACIFLLIFPLVLESITAIQHSSGCLGGPEVLELSSCGHFRKLAEGPKGRGCVSGLCPASAVIEILYGALTCSGCKRYASVMQILIEIAYEQGVATYIPCSLWPARYHTSSVNDLASHLLWCALCIYMQGLYAFFNMLNRVLRIQWMILLRMQLLSMVQFPDPLQDDHAMLIQQHVPGTMDLPKSNSTSNSSMAGTSYWAKVRHSMYDHGRNMYLNVCEQRQAHSLGFREGPYTCKTGSRKRTLTHGRVGPKSNHVHGCRSRTNLTILFSLLLWSCIVPAQSVNVDVRVDVDPTRTSEAIAAKHVGSREAQPPLRVKDISSCAKRTYRRAYARACREGGAFYKGQWRAHPWFQPVAIRTRALPNSHRTASRQQSLRTLTWNAGGLHSQVFRELETYAIDSFLDLCMIQETKWSFDGTWSTHAYHYIHSAGEAKEDRVGGVLIMISTRVAPKQADIQFHAIHPGRLLHVRINRKQPIDVLNLYQYTANDNKLTAERRHKYLLRLRHTLQGLPNRNLLIIGGDLNTTCTPQAKVCGKWILPATEAHNKDPSDLMAILSVHSLSVLNSWHRPSHGQLATFTFGQLASQIDYLICRQGQATHCAKQAAVMPSFPVAAWRDGAKHHPVFPQIVVPDYRWPKADPPKIPRIDAQQLINDIRTPAAPPALQAFREDVQLRVQQDIWQDLQELERGMLLLAQEYYPLHRADNPVDTPDDIIMANNARTMWALFRRMRSHPFTAQGVFTAWRQWQQFSKVHREHKQRAKAKSKRRKLDLLQQAQEAAEQGHMHQVWMVVKALAPKSKRKPLQLHRDGHIMTPEAELN